MKTVFRCLLAVSLVLSSVATVMAHPGHGQHGGSFGLLHYLTEPVHFGLAIGLVALVVLGAYLLKRRFSRTVRLENREDR